MADVNYSVFEGVAQTIAGVPTQTGVLAVTNAAVNSGDLNTGQFDGTVRVQADTACWIMYGPSAAVVKETNGLRLSANQTEYFPIAPGGRLSVIEI